MTKVRLYNSKWQFACLEEICIKCNRFQHGTKVKEQVTGIKTKYLFYVIYENMEYCILCMYLS